MDDNILGGKKIPIAENDFYNLVGRIDWNDIWRTRMAEWFSTINGSEGDPFRHWGMKLGLSHLSARRNVNGLIKSRIAETGIQPGESVLMIGGGPHMFAETLAKMGCRVTVVESSPEMTKVLKDPPAGTTTFPIGVIDKQWEDISLDELQEKFDLVIALHTLWMTDIGAAVEKMNAIAGAVHLFWYLTPPVWAQVMGEIWKKVHEKEFRFAPTAECLYQVLLQKKIYANISIEVAGSNLFYATIGEALEAFRICTQFSEVCQDNVVRNYLRTCLTLADSGFTLRGRSYDARISWKRREKT